MTESDVDKKAIRCPRLGSPVTFHYCETTGEDGLPCFKIFDCWWEFFNVVDYLKGKMTERQFELLSAKRPKPKITGILELIEKAQKNND